MKHVLDNSIWSALNSGNKDIALGTENVKYYPADVAPFAGLVLNTSENLNTLYEITPGEGTFAIKNIGQLHIPAPWKLIRSVPLLQMVCDDPVQRKTISDSIEELSKKHISQMLQLTTLTNPGPFRERTIDLGHYQGIFDGEQLVAMAGQRMHPLPYAEISAVCTHPDYIGRGYGAQLILSQANRIKESGGTPYLHVAEGNDRAIKLYKSLGFVTRQQMFIYFISK
ncbi:GNAT family N-acetyltransferase [Pedobacter sp. L105]|uniref:GNAT family N-acetyltransferase n=1 Tax=Pedobacter sp. L105 TaxID=1641871 RepID=UPI00131CB0BB|nr:GNAT family N-acetyltransferase [Pedobacter sp. L105]